MNFSFLYQYLGRFVQEEKTVSCNSLKKYGFTESNIYSLRSSTDKFPRLSYCDMERSNGYEDAAMETLIGYLNYMPSAEFVMFSAFRNSSVSGSQDITYTGYHANYGNSFSLNSGIFTSPISGTFQFSFSGQYNSYHNAVVQIIKNGQIISHHFCYSTWKDGYPYFDGNIAFTISLTLDKGDEVKLHFEGGNLYSDIIFEGKFILPS